MNIQLVRAKDFYKMRILSISIIQSRSFSFGLTLQTRSTTEFFHSFERNYVKNPALVCSWQDNPKTKPRGCKNECSISLYKYLTAWFEMKSLTGRAPPSCTEIQRVKWQNGGVTAWRWKRHPRMTVFLNRSHR